MITGKELAKYCSKLDCDVCDYEIHCAKFQEYMSEFAPSSLLQSNVTMKNILEHDF